LESCFYECDVNAGRYRHHEGDDACDSSNNGWQISGMPLKQSEADQFYSDCAADLFAFGTVDLPGGGVNSTENTMAIDAGRGFWNRASGCNQTVNSANTGSACCQRMDALYSGGSEAVAEMWAYGTTPAFTVVATADETANNSFSLFGGSGDNLTSGAYFTISPTAPNTNDDVCLDETVTTGLSAYAPFPNVSSCTHNVDCVSASSACTAACEAAADRTVVVTTQPNFDGTACPTSVTENCVPGMGSCAAPDTSPAPQSSGAMLALPSAISAAASVAILLN